MIFYLIFLSISATIWGLAFSLLTESDDFKMIVGAVQSERHPFNGFFMTKTKNTRHQTKTLNKETAPKNCNHKRSTVVSFAFLLPFFDEQALSHDRDSWALISWLLLIHFKGMLFSVKTLFCVLHPLLLLWLRSWKCLYWTRRRKKSTIINVLYTRCNFPFQFFFCNFFLLFWTANV